MISRMQIDFKKYNADGIGSRPATLPRVDFATLNQPWAIKSTTPMVLAHVHRFHQPTNKTTHAQSTQTKPTVHTQSTQTASTVCARNPPLPRSVIFCHAIPPKPNNHFRAICPNEAVGAVPVCPPERSRSGVFIREIGFVHHALCAGILTMDAPLQGDAGGHTGTAPTKLHHIFPHIPHKPNNHLRTIHPNETRKQSTHIHRGRKCIAHSRPHYLK